MITETITMQMPDVFTNVIVEKISKNDERYEAVHNVKKEVDNEIILDILRKNQVNIDAIHSINYNREKDKKGCMRLTIVYDYNPFYNTDFDDVNRITSLIDSEDFIKNMHSALPEQFTDVNDETTGHPFDIYVCDNGDIVPVTTKNQGFKKGDKIDDRTITNIKRLEKMDQSLVASFTLMLMMYMYQDIVNTIGNNKEKMPLLTMTKFAMSNDGIVLNGDKQNYSVLSIIASYMECYEQFLKNKNRNTADIIKEALAEIGSLVQVSNDEKQENNEETIDSEEIISTQENLQEFENNVQH